MPRSHPFFADGIQIARTPKNSLTMFSPRRHFCKSGDKELLLLSAAYMEAKVSQPAILHSTSRRFGFLNSLAIASNVCR